MHKVLITLLTLGISYHSFAASGMWMPHQLLDRAQELKSAGLESDVEVLRENIVKAVVKLENGCSGSVVSDHGLVVSNHHCIKASIVKASKKDEKILETGFVAKNRAEERSIPDAQVKFSKRIIDVTAMVTTLEGRVSKSEMKTLLKDCRSQYPNFTCEVKKGYRGARYFLYIWEVFNDVRLVHAVHDEVGSFGGMIDNFDYPRTVGDWGILRVYANPDGTPADYHKDNTPLATNAEKLSVNPQGLQANEGQFLLVAGYPGTTKRLLSHPEFKKELNISMVNLLDRYKRFADRMEGLRVEAKKAGNVELIKAVDVLWNKYTNRVQFLSGGLDLAKEHQFLQKSLQSDADLLEKLKLNPDLKKGLTYQALADLLAELERVSAGTQWDLIDEFSEAVTDKWVVPQFLAHALLIAEAALERKKPDNERKKGFKEADYPALKKALQKKQFNKDLLFLEKGKLTYLLEYYRDMGGELPFFEPLEEFVENSFAKNLMGSNEQKLALLQKNFEQLQKGELDPFVTVATRFLLAVRDRKQREKAHKAKLEPLASRFGQFLLHLRPNLATDANGTLRATYGITRGLIDKYKKGVPLGPFTSHVTLLHKATGEEFFTLPPLLRKLLEGADFAGFANPRGDLLINFLGTTDIIGGNSGSPTLDKNGRLVGLLFDGNHYLKMSRWGLLSDTRSMHVDIRYMLWALRDFYKAPHLLDEMGVLPQLKNNFRPH